MKKESRLCKVTCVLLAAVLVLLLCSAGHDCHGFAADHDCPVCLVLAVWKAVLPALALAGLMIVAPQVLCSGAAAAARREENPTLVALKVKLSD